MQYVVRGGVDTFAVYKEEVAFNTDPGTWTSGAAHFGMVQSAKFNLSRNLIKLRGLSGALPATNDTATARDAQQIKSGKFDVSFDVEFQPQNFTFLKYVFGSVSTATSTYSYPQATASTEADKKLYNTVPSISVATRFDFNGSGDNIDKVWIGTGLKNNSFNINAAKDEPVSCSLNFLGADFNGDETSIETNYPYVALSSDEVYTFAHSDVEYADTSIPNIIEAFDLTIEQTAEGLTGLGAYTNKAVVVKDRNFTVKLDLTAEGKQFMDDFMGSATAIGTPVLISSLALVLDKGSNKNLTLTLKNLKIADNSMPNMSRGEVVKESITLEAEYGYAVENVTA